MSSKNNIVNSDACRLIHFPQRPAAKRALERCNEIAKYWKRPRREISKLEPQKEVESDSVLSHSGDSIDTYLSTDSDGPIINRQPFEVSVDVHREQSLHSFDSSSTNKETQYDRHEDMHENVEIDIDFNMNEDNENEEHFVTDAEILHQETGNHSVQPERNTAYDSDDSEMIPAGTSSPEINRNSPTSSPEREITPPHFSEHSSMHSDATNSQHELPPEIEHKIVSFHGAKGKIETFGTSIIITVKGKTDEQKEFTFQSEMGNHS